MMANVTTIAPTLITVVSITFSTTTIIPTNPRVVSHHYLNHNHRYHHSGHNHLHYQHRRYHHRPPLFVSANSPDFLLFTPSTHRSYFTATATPITTITTIDFKPGIRIP
ncbi:hypothetical protein E2C01_087081 [Portunus trituberculatus]|uniref:Uncharacterized protein n=1 Tax=Portunus trituberculatus TaxID=210409 RepID=A0A5B7JCD5_PORTR|nr:hypothetical protein [Portunus trituberculatus]